MCCRPQGPLPSLSRGVLTFSPFIQHNPSHSPLALYTRTCDDPFTQGATSEFICVVVLKPKRRIYPLKSLVRIVLYFVFCIFVLAFLSTHNALRYMSANIIERANHVTAKLHIHVKKARYVIVLRPDITLIIVTFSLNTSRFICRSCYETNNTHF